MQFVTERGQELHLEAIPHVRVRRIDSHRDPILREAVTTYTRLWNYRAGIAIHHDINIHHGNEPFNDGKAADELPLNLSAHAIELATAIQNV